MRRVVLGAALLGLSLAPAAAAEPPPLTISASATSGAAPLTVTLTAAEGADSYRWELGDGTAADGRVVEHTYGGPRTYTAVVTATYADGRVAQAEAVVTAFRLTVVTPASARYGEPGRFRAVLVPALARASVTLLRGRAPIAAARTGADGSARLVARIRGPGPYRVRFGRILSRPRSLVVRPSLEARLVGSKTVGEPLSLAVRLTPPGAGAVEVRVQRNGRVTYSELHRGTFGVRLGTLESASLRIRVSLRAAPGYARVVRTLAATVVEPHLEVGSRGPAVRELERRLAELRYALPRVDALYGPDTYEAILAFQKVQGLPLSGRVDPLLWRRLLHARTPRARYLGTHIEVLKSRQVLFVVRKGLVERIVHVSTGATGNTPVGRWQVYRKVTGWDWVLWYPMYFLRGFAIHGYPSVPTYPASHGCIRVPMWIAPSLYGSHPHGTTIYVY